MLMPNFERPVAGPTYSDEYIEFWGGVYLANPHLRRRGVLFSAFLIAPAVILRAAATPVRVTCCPPRAVLGHEAVLLAMAEAAIRALEREGARCENGRWVEKLKHHAHPRSSNRDFQPRAE